MPKLEPSHGPLPSGNAFSAVPKDQLLKAYYQTTSMREVPGRAPNQECVGENYIDVHSIGKKTTRYMDYQLNKAPLIQRDACKYTQEFVTLPLGDNKVNTEMAASFKGGLAVGMKTVDAPLDGRTKYEDDFMMYSGEAMAGANCPNQKPPQERTYTLGLAHKLLETKSHEQRNLVAPNLELAKSERASLPRPGLDIGGSAKRVRSTTVMNRELNLVVHHARTMDRTVSTPEVDARGLPALHTDTDIFKMKRIPNMMPGK